MRFSLFFQMQLSEPDRRSEQQLFRDCVEQAVAADALGYHGVWATEHHGLREYSHSGAPEVFLGHLSGRTRRIRLGHGVTLTPHRYNHPVRVAERIATLDILSDGRADWGSGKSGSRVEQDAFAPEPDGLDEQWREALRMVPAMWRDGVFEWHSDVYDVPPTQVVPKPVQQPHPPMFAACTNPRSSEQVGALGVGALNFAAGTDADLTATVARYRAAVATAAPVEYTPTDRYICTPTTLVLDDDRLACENGFRGARFFWQSMQQYYAHTDRPVGRLPVERGDLDPPEVERMAAARSEPGSRLTGVIGDAAAARELVGRFAAAGVDELGLIMQSGTVPHELIMTSIRLFAEKVMPDFAD